MSKHDDTAPNDLAKAPPQLTAAQARQKIIAGSEPNKVSHTFKGVSVELRQPTITQFLTTNQTAEGEERNQARVTIKMIIEYTYLEGTDDKLFEDADLDALLNMPMSGEFFEMISKMNDLLDIKVDSKVKN